MIMLFNTNEDESVRKLSAYLEDLNDQNKDKLVCYTIEIKKNRPIRSVKANRYYRAVLQCISSFAGYDEDDLHEMYKKKFNGKWVLDELIGHTTTDMDSKDFSTFVKKVKDHGRAFFGAHIAEPEDEKYAAWEMMTKNNYDQMFASI